LLRELKDKNRSAKFEVKEDHDLKYAIRSLAYNILYGKARCVDRLIKKLKEIMDGPVNPHIQTHQRDAENQATGQTPQAPDDNDDTQGGDAALATAATALQEEESTSQITPLKKIAETKWSFYRPCFLVLPPLLPKPIR